MAFLRTSKENEKKKEGFIFLFAKNNFKLKKSRYLSSQMEFFKDLCQMVTNFRKQEFFFGMIALFW